MLKILQARLQQYVNHELSDVQAGFRKELEFKLPTSAGSSKKQEFQKTIYSYFIDYAKAFVWITTIWKILQPRLQQYVNRELPDVQAGFRKAEEPEIKLPTYAGS